jgi:uncharacterized membrane protein YqjE
MSTTVRHQPEDTREASVGELVKRASEEFSEVMHSEARLAQAEMKQKGKAAGLGGGMFGGAAVFGLLALWSLVVAAIAAVTIVLPVWASALVVAGALFLIAGIMALAGKLEFGSATPAKPAQTIDSVKADVQAVKEGAHR